MQRPKPRKWAVIAVLILAGTLAGCGGKTGEEAAAPSAAPAAGPLATVAEQSPQSRPMDLAIFTPSTVFQHIRFSKDLTPIGRADLPWLVEPPALDAGSSFLPTAAPYWCAPLPAEVLADLGRECYVSQVMVQPLSERFGVTAFEVRLVSPQGEMETVPPARYTAEPATPPSDRPGQPLVVSFTPRLASQVKISFTRGGWSNNDPEWRPPNTPEKMYVRHIRILGVPKEMRSVPRYASPEVEATLKTNAENLALLPSERRASAIRVSEDRFPNGRFDAPFSQNPPLQPDGSTLPPYWCAAAPAWVELSLDEPSWVNGVGVHGHSTGAGVGAFYATVVTPEGDEFDTVPPCVAQEGALTAAFRPVLASKLRFYFTQGATGAPLVYVNKITVSGIKARP